MYDGKDYFTICDFVKAYHHFSDPEWDGEPIEPEPEPRPKPPAEPVPPGPEPEPGPRPQQIKIKLADGKARTIQHMMMTSFWHPDRTPMSAQHFMELLFGKLPEFFQDEDELPALWSDPDTRAKLLDGLAEKGFGPEQWPRCSASSKPKKAISSTYWHIIAYALPPISREERASGREKLPPLLRLKYHAITDAVAELGRPEQIGVLFSSFQKYLYEQSA